MEATFIIRQLTACAGSWKQLINILNNLEKGLEQYINDLLDEGKNDKVWELIEKYKDILTGTDFDVFADYVERALKEKEYTALLSVVQELIIAEDYDQLVEVAAGKEYQDMSESLQEDESYYIGEYGQNGE